MQIQSYPYDSSFKGDDRIPTIKNTEAVIYIIGFTMAVGPKIQDPRTPGGQMRS